MNFKNSDADQLRIGIVIGTRPHIAKIYPLQKAVREAGLQCTILHTNQHYDYNMQRLLFEELDYSPDEVMEQYSLGAAVDWVRGMIRNHQLDFVFLQGDSAPAVVGSIAAIYSDIGIGHVEAGLRASDNLMVEERNRIIADSASHYLFSYCEEHADNLRQENFFRGRIFVVGNPTVDLLNELRPRLLNPHDRPFLYVTLHRKELTEDPPALCEVLGGIGDAAKELDMDIVFPIHPRTRNALKDSGIKAEDYLGAYSRLLPPVGIIDSLSFAAYAQVVVTDSGCLQEEACILTTPCVTLRENSERPETLRIGANVLAGIKKDNITRLILAASEKETTWQHPYGKGDTVKKIVEIVSNNFKNIRHY